MNIKKGALVLGWLTALAALIASAGGLFWPSDYFSPAVFTTPYGTQVEIFGQGLYRFDPLFKATLMQGTNAAVLLIALPLLIYALQRIKKGGLRSQVLLAGLLGFFVYNAASLAFGHAYNDLFIVYLVYFPASLMAFIFSCLAVDLQAMGERLGQNYPHRWLAVFMLLTGLSALIWVVIIFEALMAGQVPQGMDSYTTEVTYFVDLGLIAPLAFVSAVLIWRREAAGFFLASLILPITALIGPVVIAQSITQTRARIDISLGETLTFVGPFVVVSIIAAFFLVSMLRRLQPSNA